MTDWCEEAGFSKRWRLLGVCLAGRKEEEREKGSPPM